MHLSIALRLRSWHIPISNRAFVYPAPGSASCSRALNSEYPLASSHQAREASLRRVILKSDVAGYRLQCMLQNTNISLTAALSSAYTRTDAAGIFFLSVTFCQSWKVAIPSFVLINMREKLTTQECITVVCRSHSYLERKCKAPSTTSYKSCCCSVRSHDHRPWASIVRKLRCESLGRRRAVERQSTAAESACNTTNGSALWRPQFHDRM